MEILLFGGGLQVLSAARSLKEVGYYVHNLVYNDRVCYYSNYIDQYHELGISLNNISLETLTRRIKEINPAVVIPTQDLYAQYLSSIKDDVEKLTSIKCAIVDNDLLATVLNKSSFMNMCKSLNIPHPKTEPLYEENLEAIGNIVGYPSLIKPDISEGARGITIVNSIEDLKNKYPSLVMQYGKLSLQEFINTKDYYYNLMIYRCKDGSWGNYTITKILRFYPIKGGSSSFCVTVDIPKMVEMCKQLLDNINWVGFADFDILEKEDGDYRIIEINPRLPASIRAAAISGINFPECIVSDMLDKEIKFYNYKPGKYLRFLGLDIAWLISSPNRFKVLFSWLNFFGKNVFYQEGGINDFKSMLVSIFSGIKKQLDPSFRKSKSGMNS